MWPALIFPPFHSCRALHPLLIQMLKISFQTQLAFSPSKCRRLWRFFPLPFILCEHFLFHCLIKIIIEVTEKGVLIIYRRKHIKGPLSRPIRRLLKPLLVAMLGLSVLLGSFNSFLCQKFFFLITLEGGDFHYSRAWPCCCYLLFVKLLTAEPAKRSSSFLLCG